VKRLKTFVYGILAGISIAIGGTAFLSVESKPLGSLLFTVGLFTICTFGFSLFTGKVCYVFERDRDYAIDLPVIWLGNLCGTWLAAFAESLTRTGPALAEKAQAEEIVRLLGQEIPRGRTNKSLRKSLISVKNSVKNVLQHSHLHRRGRLQQKPPRAGQVPLPGFRRHGIHPMRL